MNGSPSEEMEFEFGIQLLGTNHGLNKQTIRGDKPEPDKNSVAQCPCALEPRYE